MSADLLHRLRYIAKMNYHRPTDDEEEDVAGDCAEAADELERLQAECAALRQVRDDAVNSMRECEVRMRSAEAERDELHESWHTDNTKLIFARLYAYLRDPQRSRGSNLEVAALWEELITNDCTGERFDAVVQRMMELDP